MKRDTPISDDPQWYKDAIFYEVRVRSFFDSDGDGVGDFPGLTAKLDYLEDLGVSTLWLLPFYPSPLRDDGYDIADYLDVHPDYGSIGDFKTFLREAHRRGLRVVTELVINHTSDAHPWFQRARHAPPGSRERDYYVWSESAERYAETRIIFKDFEPSNWTWDPVARAHYWHRFYAHQPDLNFDSPDVRRAVLRVVDFWLGMGVDGLRLDAVPYLFEREGTSCENLPETHAYLRELRAHVDRRFPNRMLLAEANQWPEDAVAYLGAGDECHMAFHFPIMPRMYLAVRTEDRFPLIDILAQTPIIPESCQWALFLRNHDELTLEMVTDEERDFMYRAYAHEARMRINLGIRRRLAPIFGNNRRAIELLNGLLFSLPGTPVIYYGDEIGMGDNIYLGDRNGVRTPMQWSADRNAGFSRANPQRLVLPPITDHEYHYEAVNVESQQSNRHSLLWWMKRLITLRKRHIAFGRGSIEVLSADNPKCLAFIRCHGAEQILVVANLSRFVQLVRVALPGRRGLTPIELFGRTPFPEIGEQPYLFTLGPHGFYWFALEASRAALLASGGGSAMKGELVAGPEERRAPVLELSAREAVGGRGRAALQGALSAFLRRSRWFGGKARRLKSAELTAAVPLSERGEAWLGLVRVEYDEGEAETYLLPLAALSGTRAAELRAQVPAAVVAELRPGRDAEGVLIDASHDPEFGAALLGLLERRRVLRTAEGEVAGVQAAAFARLRGEGALPVRVLGVEQSNTSLVYGDRLMLKLFRRLEPGVSADLDLMRHLTERAAFAHSPPLAGWLELRAGRAEPVSLGVLEGFVANEGDAWRYTREEVQRFFERVAARREPVAPPGRPLLALLGEEPPAAVRDLIGAYLDAARLLGRRTGELHLALGDAQGDPDFRPEPHTGLYQRSTYQSMRNLTGAVFRLLRKRLPGLPEELQGQARELVARERRVLGGFESYLRRKITAPRIRTHGDYHLGQVLYTGKDFVIIDFEGEPARPLVERRRKRPALRDVAGMIRSFHYAAFGALRELGEEGRLAGAHAEELGPYADLWQVWSSWAFLGGYLGAMSDSPLIPRDREELGVLLDAFLLEKAVYELGYELNNRPGWVAIPMHGIRQILG